MVSIYVIETILPDGPHWYAGIQEKRMGGQSVKGPLWSPFFVDAKPFDTKEGAAHAIENYIKDTGQACYIVDEGAALQKDSRVTLPVDTPFNPLYAIRQKYVQPGWYIRSGGTEFEVVSVGEKEIIFQSAGSKFRKSVSRRSNQFVHVISENAKQYENSKSNK